LLQIAAAKIAVDLETDDKGSLSEEQRRTYQASMRHEHQIYERLQACQGGSNGIPRVYFAGEPWTYARLRKIRWHILDNVHCLWGLHS
jgi:hypothetical protein